MTHGVLTESSVSDHVVTHDRKGREGKGSRKGRRVACDSMHRHLGDASIGAPRRRTTQTMHGSLRSLAQRCER